MFSLLIAYWIRVATFTNINFNPFDSSLNRMNVSWIKDHALIINLEKETIYILVITTYNPNKVGSFSVIVTSKNNITLKRISVYKCMIAMKNNIAMYHVDFSSVTIEPIYSSELNMNSSKFCLFGNEPLFYYEAMQINFVEDGIYAFSSGSRMSTYGYIYKDQFNPFDPLMNQIQDIHKDCAGHFHIALNLQKKETYILVISMLKIRSSELFSIFAIGPSNVTFNRLSEYFKISLFVNLFLSFDRYFISKCPSNL